METNMKEQKMEKKTLTSSEAARMAETILIPLDDMDNKSKMAVLRAAISAAFPGYAIRIKQGIGL